MVGARVDWIGFRFPFSGSVRGSGVLDAWHAGGRFLWRNQIPVIPRFCDDAVVGGRTWSGMGVDWF